MEKGKFPPDYKSSLFVYDSFHFFKEAAEERDKENKHQGV